MNPGTVFFRHPVVNNIGARSVLYRVIRKSDTPRLAHCVAVRSGRECTVGIHPAFVTIVSEA